MSVINKVAATVRPGLLEAIRDMRAGLKAGAVGDVALARRILDRASASVSAVRDQLRVLDSYATQVLELVEAARARLEGKPATLTPVLDAAGNLSWEDEAHAVEREIADIFRAPERHLRVVGA